MSDDNKQTPEDKPEQLRGLPPGLEPPPGIKLNPEVEPKRKSLSLRPRDREAEPPTVLPPGLEPPPEIATGTPAPKVTEPTAEPKSLRPKLQTPSPKLQSPSPKLQSPSPASAAPRIQAPTASEPPPAEVPQSQPPKLKIPDGSTPPAAPPKLQIPTPQAAAPAGGLSLSSKKAPPPLPPEAASEGASPEAPASEEVFPPGMGPPVKKAAAAGSAAAQQQVMREKSEKIMRMIKLSFMGIGFVLLIVAGFFVYKLWLHPYAKIVWEVPGTGDGPSHTLKADESTMIVKVGKEFMKLSPVDGSVAWRADSGEPDWGQIDVSDLGIILYKPGQMQRISTEGKKMWSISFEPSKQRLLTYNQYGALFLTGHLLTTLEYLNWQIAEGRYTRNELFGDGGMYGGDWGGEDKPTNWMNKDLVAYSMKTGEQIWTVPAKDDLQFGTFDMNASYCVGVLSKAVKGAGAKVGRALGGRPREWGMENRLVILDATSGSLYERVILPEDPTWGPELDGDKIMLSTFTNMLTLNRAGRVVAKGVPKQRAWGARDDDMEDDAFSPHRSRDPAIQSTGSGIAFVDPATGNEKWKFSLPGGITDFDATDEVVVVTGHATEAGANREAVAQGASQVLGSDASSGFMAAAVTVYDYVLIGLDRNTGEKLWEKDKLTGEILCDKERIVLLQDTAKTSPTIRASGGRGELIIHQFKPKSGGNIYSRKHKDLAIREPRLLNGQLVGLKYDREESKLNPATRGNCLGVCALKLK